MKKIHRVIFIIIFVLIPILLNGCNDKNTLQNDETKDNMAETLENDKSKEEDITMIYIELNGTKLEVTLEENSATKELVQKLKESSLQFL